MLKKILLGLVAIIAILLIVAAMRPDDFRVERSAIIAASPAALFDQVNDHHKFTVWNPFAKIDPNVKNTFTGPPSGVGAACTWSGNDQIGEGTSTIIESKPGELLRLRMDFKRPMESTCTTDFTFKPEGDKTKVTWAMYGKQPFIGKVMSLFMSCDEMVGKDFAEGLNNLAAVVTAPPKP